jgi:hypothetical protein
MSMNLKTAAIAAMLAALPAAAMAADDVSRFDGTWSATYVCPATTSPPSMAYQWHFLVAVSDGKVSGQFNNPGRPNSAKIVGLIKPDGSAGVRLDGLTGNAQTTMGQVSAGTPFTARIRAHFDAQRGDGTRLGGRPCTITFMRQ